MNFIIDIATLKKRSFIASDVNTENLIVTLQRVQDRFLEPVLGTKLFKRLLKGVEDEDLSDNEKTLIEDYILKFVCVGCELKATVHNNYKIRNKSVGTASDEHVRSNSLNEGNALADELKKDLSFYRNRLVGLITDNEDLFEEYTCSSSSEDLDPAGKGTNYSNKISFI